MVRLTAVTGALLIALGIGGYAVTAGASITALIPAFAGLVFLVLAWIGARERYRRHAMHGAALLALLGILGSAQGIPPALTVIAGGEVARPEAAVARAFMALICAAYLVVAVRSFVLARRRSGPAERS